MNGSETNNLNCECSHHSRISEVYHALNRADAPPAMGYIPWQHGKCEKLFPRCKALHAGTIFPSLYKPFCGKGGKKW